MIWYETYNSSLISLPLAFTYQSLWVCLDSLTDSDESDDHKDTLKRRRKQKSRPQKSVEPDSSMPSEDDRDFVTLPDPPKVGNLSVLIALCCVTIVTYSVESVLIPYPE